MNKQPESILKIATLIGPQTRGIVWVSKEKIDKRPAPFEEIDYLFNGILSEGLNHHQGKTKSEGLWREQNSFFQTDHFDRNIFLAYFTFNPIHTTQEIEKVLEDLMPPERRDEEIVLIDQAQNNLAEELQSRRPYLKIKNVGPSLLGN